MLPVITYNEPKKEVLCILVANYRDLLDATLKEITLLSAFYGESGVLPKVMEVILRISSIKCRKF